MLDEERKLRLANVGVPTMSEERVIIKDDSDQVEMIMEGQELRRQYGVPEPDTTKT